VSKNLYRSSDVAISIEFPFQMEAIPDSAQNASPQEKNTPLAMQRYTVLVWCWNLHRRPGGGIEEAAAGCENSEICG
jgi:hypothetical protein